jgi:hypothetical protein
MPTLARHLQSAGTGRTGLWGSTGALVLSTYTSPLDCMPTLARHVQGAGELGKPCVEPAQNSPGCGGTPEVWDAKLAQDAQC